MHKKDELQLIFALFANENNKIPEESVTKALACARCVVNEKDVDVGSLDLNEFKNLVSNYRTNGISRDEIEASFKVFDKDETGYITASQLKKILLSGENSLSNSDAQYLLEHYGLDDRGMICYKLLIERVFDDS